MKFGHFVEKRKPHIDSPLSTQPVMARQSFHGVVVTAGTALLSPSLHGTKLQV